MELPTGVLSYGFKNANLSDEKQRLIQAIVVSLTYENMKKQLKAIFDSSTSSQSSEGVDIKSKPVFYTKLMIVKVTKVKQISTQKMVIDTVNFLQVEDAIIVKNKMLEKTAITGDKKQILLANQAMFRAVLFVSPFIIGLMTAQIK